MPHKVAYDFALIKRMFYVGHGSPSTNFYHSSELCWIVRAHSKLSLLNTNSPKSQMRMSRVIYYMTKGKPSDHHM